MLLLAAGFTVAVLLGYLGGLVNAAQTCPNMPKGRKFSIGVGLYLAGVPICFLVAGVVGLGVGSVIVQMVMLVVLAFPYWALAHAIYSAMDKKTQHTSE